MGKVEMKGIAVTLFSLSVIGILATISLMMIINDREKAVSAQVLPVTAQARAAYYSEEQAVAFVRGWLSDIKVGALPGPVNNCLYIKEGTLSDSSVKWNGTWTGSHWEVRLGPTMYEFWEEFWKVTSKNGGGC